MQMRIPKLTGALNFRDLGGYAGADGRTVKWNTLYRSGTTHAMTLDDIGHLERCGIRFAYDLRSNGERQDSPSRLLDIADIDYRYREHDHLPGNIRRLLTSADVRPEQSVQVMMSLYRQLPDDFQDAFRSLFGCLVDGNLPLVFNCAAGKDRTGVAAALILSALGVSRDTVLEDYMLTEQFFDRSCELILSQKYSAMFANLDRSVWAPLMGVRAEYLDAMFDQLQHSYGSVEHYLNRRLGMGATEIDRLRANLLE